MSANRQLDFLYLVNRDNDHHNVSPFRWLLVMIYSQLYQPYVLRIIANNNG